MNTYNPILDTDSYKASHWLQMPPGSEYQSSYIESRGGKWPVTVFFGLQIYLKERLSKPITRDHIDEAESFLKAHGEPFNRAGWEHILNNHDGYMPITISAVPEGSVVPAHNVLVQSVNSDPKVAWLTSYLETPLIRAVWYPSTVATNSYMCKREIYEALLESSDDPDGQIGFKLHDFGARGVSSLESAGVGGAAHLVNFLGTDTISGALVANKYYGEPMAGFSIPASEHSTITSWGGPEKEIEAFDNMLNQFAKPGKLVACVSDSYDIYRATRALWGNRLKQKIIDSGATLVVRPDSGDPTVIPIQVVKALMESFGYEINSKGYKVLPPYIRVIQGDGIKYESLKEILRNMLGNKLSIDNIAFGMGGGLLQEVNRDTLKFAMKCSAIQVGGFWRDVYKEPVTDVGKHSKRGRLSLTCKDGVYETKRLEETRYGDDILKPVFQNGRIIQTYSFSEVREKAKL